MRQLIWLFLAFSAVAAHAVEEVRTWTNKEGRTMQAQFVREVDGDVTFLKDGKIITLPLDQLSEEDQKFIRNAEGNKKVEEAALPAGAPRPITETPLPLDSPPASDVKSSLTKQKVIIEERTWRDLRGKPQVGKFVRIHQGFVVISSGSRAIRVPYYDLSQPDREYLRELLTARGELAQLPPEIPADASKSSPEQGPGNVSNDGDSPIAPQAGAPSRPASGTNPALPADDARQSLAELNEKNLERTRSRSEQISQENAARAERLNQSLQAREEARRNAPVGYCTKCKNPITNEERKLNKCPHCGSTWQFEVNRFGHKRTISGTSAAGGTDVGFKLAHNRGQLDLKEPRNIVGFIIGLPIVAAIVSLLTAIVLRAAAYMVSGDHLPYGDAYGTMFLSYIANGAIGFVFTLALQSMTEPTDGTNPLSFLMLPIAFLVQTGIISTRHETDFGPACLVSLAVWLIWFAILFVVILFVFLAFGVLPGQA